MRASFYRWFQSHFQYYLAEVRVGEEIFRFPPYVFSYWLVTPYWKNFSVLTKGGQKIVDKVVKRAKKRNCNVIISPIAISRYLEDISDWWAYSRADAIKRYINAVAPNLTVQYALLQDWDLMNPDERSLHGEVENQNRS